MSSMGLRLRTFVLDRLFIDLNIKVIDNFRTECPQPLSALPLLPGQQPEDAQFNKDLADVNEESIQNCQKFKQCLNSVNHSQCS